MKIPISYLCSYFNVSESGYYFWCNKSEGSRFIAKEKYAQKSEEFLNYLNNRMDPLGFTKN